MRKKNSYKKQNICFGGKVALVPFVCLLILTFIFTFSCDLNDSPLVLDDNQATGSETGEESQDTGQEQTTDTDENAVSEEEVKEEGQPEEEEEAETGELTINIYYSDATVQYLVGEARVVSAESKYVDALNELMKLPVDGSLYRLVPDSTKINSITVEDGMARIDLSSNFVDDRLTSDTEDILLIYSVVNTLTEFSDVNSISFYIDGEKLDILGQIDISEPIFRRNDLIK